MRHSITRTRFFFAFASALPICAALLAYACIPDPDLTGVPARDGGPDTIYTPPPTSDATHDGGTDADANEGAAQDTGPGVGSIVGVVVDYTQGAGRGVLPGAKIRIEGTTLSTTSDASGRFTLTNVPAGAAVMTVSHETDTVQQVAYSTLQVPLTVTSGQATSAFPVLHEGCYVTIDLSVFFSSAQTLNLQNGCEQRVGAYAALTIPDNTSFLDATTSALFGGTARVELIPLAYPRGGAVDPDLSWAIGLPGDLTVAGGAIDLVGAGEVHVVDNATGKPLAINNGHVVTFTMAIDQAPPQPTALSIFQYDATQTKWVQGAAATALEIGQTTPPGNSQPISTFSTPITQLTWWGLGSVRAQSGCVAGSLLAAAASTPGANAVVRGMGVETLRASIATANNAGQFCLDVPPSQHVQVVAGYVTAGGTVYETSGGFATGASGHSCAGDQTQCARLSILPMLQIDPSCASGSLERNVDLAPVTVPLDTLVTNLALTNGQLSTGLTSTAYVGRASPSDAGSFCVPSTRGATMALRDPAACPNDGGAGQGASFVVPAEAGAGACGSDAGCADLGLLYYNCNNP